MEHYGKFYYADWGETNEKSKHFIKDKPFGTIYHQGEYIVDYQPFIYGGLEYSSKNVIPVELPIINYGSSNKYQINPWKASQGMRFTYKNRSTNVCLETTIENGKRIYWFNITDWDADSERVWVEDENYYNGGYWKYVRPNVLYCQVKFYDYAKDEPLNTPMVEIDPVYENEWGGIEFKDKDYVAKVQVKEISAKYYNIPSYTDVYFFRPIWEKAPDQNFSNKKYRITFQIDDDTDFGPYTTYGINTGETYRQAMGLYTDACVEPVKQGYEFLGWYNDRYGYTMKLDDTWAITHNASFRPLWKKLDTMPNRVEKKDGCHRMVLQLGKNEGQIHHKNEHQREFYLNTGEHYWSSKDNFIGYAPRRNGYIFKGWYNKEYDYLISGDNCDGDYVAIGKQDTFLLEYDWYEYRRISKYDLPENLETLASDWATVDIDFIFDYDKRWELKYFVDNILMSDPRNCNILYNMLEEYKQNNGYYDENLEEEYSEEE